MCLFFMNWTQSWSQVLPGKWLDCLARRGIIISSFLQAEVVFVAMMLLYEVGSGSVRDRSWTV